MARRRARARAASAEGRSAKDASRTSSNTANQSSLTLARRISPSPFEHIPWHARLQPRWPSLLMVFRQESMPSLLQVHHHRHLLSRDTTYIRINATQQKPPPTQVVQGKRRYCTTRGRSSPAQHIREEAGGRSAFHAAKRHRIALA